MYRLSFDINYYGGFDALSGFDMLSLTERASYVFCIATPFGTFGLKGAPMGFIDTPMVYQQRVIRYILGGGTEDSLLARQDRSEEKL